MSNPIGFGTSIGSPIDLSRHSSGTNKAPKEREARKEMFGLGMKNTTDHRELWRFFITKAKEYLRRRTFHKVSKLKSLVDWTIIRSIDSMTVKTYCRIISDDNKSPMA